MRLRLPPQILRLVLLTIMIVGSYFVARAFLTPPSFGRYGWYRADALEEIAARKPVFAGKRACDECHSDILHKMAKDQHRTVSCESCHGVSQDHADNPDIKAGIIKDHIIDANIRPAASAETGTNGVTAVAGKYTGIHCMRCHEANPSRPPWLKQIVVKDHYNGKCADCHAPHQPNEVP
jgi:hypothetical protein